MKVLAPYAYFFPEHAASSYLWQNLHEDFAKEDIDCVIYVPTPTRGVSEDVRKEYKRNHRVDTLYDGKLTIHRFSLIKEGRNPILRAARYAISCIIQFCKCMWGKDAKKCDVLFIASTPPILGVVGALVHKFRGIPFVYNLQDIFPDSLVSTGLSKKGSLAWKIGAKMERFIYKHANKIIVISEGFKKNIMAKGVPESKIEVIYNWVDEKAVKPISREDNVLIQRYNIDKNKFIITYCGNIGHTQNLSMLLDVMKDLQESHPDILLVLIGDGAYKKQVEDSIVSMNLSNVRILPFQPYEDISHVFSLGDTSLVISKEGVGSNSVPSKTWSIMSAARPVIANFDKNELEDILEGNSNMKALGLTSCGKCGVFTKAGDKEVFLNAIMQLYQDTKAREEMGKNGREFILANLTRDIGTHKYIEVLNNISTL